MTPKSQTPRHPDRAYAFPRTKRLLDSAAFQRVFDHGQPLRSKHFTVLFATRTAKDHPEAENVGVDGVSSLDLKTGNARKSAEGNARPDPPATVPSSVGVPVGDARGRLALESPTTDAQPPRLGLVVAKRQFRRAVARNRVKRRLREGFRLYAGRPDSRLVNVDIVVIARKGLETLDSASFYRAFDEVLSRIERRLGATPEPVPRSSAQLGGASPSTAQSSHP